MQVTNSSLLTQCCLGYKRAGLRVKTPERMKFTIRMNSISLLVVLLTVAIG